MHLHKQIPIISIMENYLKKHIIKKQECSVFMPDLNLYGGINHPLKLPRIISKVDPDVVRNILPSFSLILNPGHPGMEPSLRYNNTIMGKTFGVTFYGDDGL